jgi:hypothetical protein
MKFINYQSGNFRLKQGAESCFSALKDQLFIMYLKRLKSEIDSNGWGRIETQVYIPEPKQFLKFYLWNKGSDPLYFDDLKISRIEEP